MKDFLTSIPLPPIDSTSQLLSLENLDPKQESSDGGSKMIFEGRIEEGLGIWCVSFSDLQSSFMMSKVEVLNHLLPLFHFSNDNNNKDEKEDLKGGGRENVEISRELYENERNLERSLIPFPIYFPYFEDNWIGVTKNEIYQSLQSFLLLCLEEEENIDCFSFSLNQLSDLIRSQNENQIEEEDEINEINWVCLLVGFLYYQIAIPLASKDEPQDLNLFNCCWKVHGSNIKNWISIHLIDKENLHMMSHDESELDLLVQSFLPQQLLLEEIET